MSLEVNVTIAGHKRIDFDRKPVRRAVALESREVRKLARKLVSRRSVSMPGEYPGLSAGNLRRSISARVKGRGFVGIVSIRPTPKMQADKFFPDILVRGTRKTNRIKPRANFITDAMETRRPAIESALLAALQSSLIPRR
jgi:hypothetical protein